MVQTSGGAKSQVFGPWPNGILATVAEKKESHMRDGIFAAATVLYVLALCWAYMNRGSEKIITTLCLGVVALLGSLFAVVLFGSEPEIHRVFSTAIMLHADTRLPFDAPFFTTMDPSIVIQAREKLQAQPNLLPDATKDSFAQNIYHQLLQRAIIAWLELKYPNTWEAEVFPLNLADSTGFMFQGKPVPSRVYMPEELAKKLTGNVFADLRGPFGGGNSVGFAVPVGTGLEILTPHNDRSAWETSRIRLSNKFCTLAIETHVAGGMVGAGGYRLLLGVTQDQAQEIVKTDQYTITISAQFSRFLAGHPEMPKYKKWALDIADGLQSQFDERGMWSRAKEHMLLYRETQ